MFTIYERETLWPIGNSALHGIDHRNRSASFGIFIGEPGCRGKGYGPLEAIAENFEGAGPSGPAPSHSLQTS